MFHKRVILELAGQKFTALQIEFDPYTIEFAKEQAKRKAEGTASASQNGQPRAHALKVCKQFSGCLSEIAVAYLLGLIAAEEVASGRFMRVVRYDDIRTDGYASAAGEFDIRMLFPAKDEFLAFGVRSSVSFKQSLQNGISGLNIIGPYTNKVKRTEEPSDFYVQPIFQLKLPDEALKNSSEVDFCGLFDKGLIDLYLVGGCSKATMMSSTKTHSLGQPDTTYRLVGISDGSDCDSLSAEIKDAIASWFDAHPDRDTSIKAALWFDPYWTREGLVGEGVKSTGLPTAPRLVRARLLGKSAKDILAASPMKDAGVTMSDVNAADAFIAAQGWVKSA